MEKTTVNSGNGTQEAHIEMSAENGGQTAEKRAVECLSELIDGIKDKKTPLDIMAHYYMIYGFAFCCQQCGFITEENADKLMNIVKKMIDDAFQKMMKIKFS